MAGILALTTLAFGWTYFKSTSKTTGDVAMRLSFEPPAGLAFNNMLPDWAVISPDGQRIVFSATDPAGKNMLYVRELTSSEAKLLPGSDNPLEPFWSPDSRSVAYGSNGKLKRSDLSGGNAQVLCDSARMVGGSWSKDGVIVFGPDYRQPLVQVSAKGGEPQAVAMNGEEGYAERHRYPYFLPDGRHFLFYRETKGVWAGSLDSPDITQVVSDNSPAIYSKGGWLIFIRNDALVAQAFDANKLSLSGEPVPIITDQKTWINNFRFSASDTGILVWQGTWETDYQLVWYDREGKQVGVVAEAEKVAVGQDPRISPDGKHIAIKRSFPNTIWVLDAQSGTSVRITSDFGQMPVWSPDGSRLVYSSPVGLSIKASNGLGDAITLPTTGAPFPFSWSPDGRFLIFLKRGVRTRLDMYAIALDGERKETLLLNSPFDDDDPSFSPDGRWLAYAADDTGTPEIYVQSFADGALGSDRKRISSTGGRMPVWNRKGTELYFLAPDGNLMASSVKPESSGLEFSPPIVLFKTRMLGRGGAVHEFDVSPDGQRFLIGTLIGDTKVPPPTVILNWPALVAK
jgi:Tol biopolymer transport system component